MTTSVLPYQRSVGYERMKKFVLRGEKDFKVQKVFRAKVPTNEWPQRCFEIVATGHEIQ